MTRIIMMIDPKTETMLLTEDPRDPLELVKAINTGAWLPVEYAAPDLCLAAADPDATPDRDAAAIGGKRAARHWAVSHGWLDVVTVVPIPPPVALTPRHYDVLFGLAEDEPAKQIAGRLGISRRTVYLYIAELKERLGAKSRAHLVALAIDKGLLSRLGSLFE